MNDFPEIISTFLCMTIPAAAIVFGISIFISIINSINNQIKWCEKCNSWQKMKRRYGAIVGWDCPTCNWTNQQFLGSCPHCGWQPRYEEDRIISRRGPFQKIDREDVNLFYGVQTKYMAYELQINCPKHGIYTSYIPADMFEYSRHDDEYYDE